MERKVKAIALVQKLIKERSGVDVAFEKYDDYTYTCGLKIDGVDSLSLKEKSMCLFFGHEYDGFLPIEIDVRWVYLRGGNNGHTIMYVWYKDGSLKIREVGGSLVEWKPRLTMQQYAKEVLAEDISLLIQDGVADPIGKITSEIETVRKKVGYTLPLLRGVEDYLRGGGSTCEMYDDEIEKMGFSPASYWKDLAKEYALLFIFKEDEQHFKIL